MYAPQLANAIAQNERIREANREAAKVEFIPLAEAIRGLLDEALATPKPRSSAGEGGEVLKSNSRGRTDDSLQLSSPAGKLA